MICENKRSSIRKAGKAVDHRKQGKLKLLEGPYLQKNLPVLCFLGIMSKERPRLRLGIGPWDHSWFIALHNSGNGSISEAGPDQLTVEKLVGRVNCRNQMRC